MKKNAMLLAVMASLILPGCMEKGLGQKAGERADEIVDNIKKGDSPLKEKGPMEKVGDSIDNAVGKTDKR